MSKLVDLLEEWSKLEEDRCRRTTSGFYYVRLAGMPRLATHSGGIYCKRVTRAVQEAFKSDRVDCHQAYNPADVDEENEAVAWVSRRIDYLKNLRGNRLQLKVQISEGRPLRGEARIESLWGNQPRIPEQAEKESAALKELKEMMEKL